MGYDHILADKSYEQVDRCLLKVPHPKIQRLLLSGFKVYRVDPLLSKMHLESDVKGYKEIVLYPHYLANTNTYLSNRQATKEENVQLIRYNAARIIRALRNKELTTEERDGQIIVYRTEPNENAMAKRFDSWIKEAKKDTYEVKKKAKTAEAIAANIKSLAKTRCTGPGHVFFVITRTKKKRKEVKELLPDDYLYADMRDTVTPTEVKDFMDKTRDAHAAKRTANRYDDKDTPKETLVVFADRVMDTYSFLSNWTWDQMEKRWYQSGSYLRTYRLWTTRASEGLLRIY